MAGCSQQGRPRLELDWVFLSVGGFFLGAFLYSGYYTTKYEPEVKGGYTIIGAGITIAVSTSIYVDFTHRISDWWRGLTLLGYTIVSIGLVVIIRERRGEKK